MIPSLIRKASIVLLLIIFLLIPSIVNSHDVDRNENSGWDQLVHLGLDDPVFNDCVFHYWHWRRSIVEMANRHIECVAKVDTIHAERQWPHPFWQHAHDLPNTIRNYYSTFAPAFAAVSQPGDLANCQAHEQAGKNTFDLFELFTVNCEDYLAQIQ